MELTQLANLGEAIGGFAVVGSLIYLAYELRTSTKTLKASKAAQSSEFWATFNETMMQNDMLLDLIRKVHVDKCKSEELSTAELLRLNFYCRSVLQRVEAEFFLYEAGIHPLGVYQNRLNNVRSWMKLPAWQNWWEREKMTPMFSQDFVSSLFPELENT